MVYMQVLLVVPLGTLLWSDTDKFVACAMKNFLVYVFTECTRVNERDICRLIAELVSWVRNKLNYNWNFLKGYISYISNI